MSNSAVEDDPSDIEMSVDETIKSPTHHTNISSSETASPANTSTEIKKKVTNSECYYLTVFSYRN